MKKKLLFLLPVLLGLVLSSCNTKAESSNSSKREQSSSNNQTTSEVKQYLITFKDEKGNTLESKKWDEGVIPSYNYEKSDTEQWDYTFVGWSLTLNGEIIELPKVSGEVTYYAIVKAVKQKYTITFDTDGGSLVDSITEDYGTSISEPSKPTKDGYKFVSWASDKDGQNKITWPVTLTKNETYYAIWNEKVDIKGYLKTLMGALKQDPYSYIPETMQPINSKNHVTADSVNYDFTNSTQVSDIIYGGYGEQWHMVIENIKESERFYSVITLGETLINSSVIAFNNYLDNNPSDTADHALKETTYTAKLNFKDDVLSYTIQYATNLTIPLFGEVLPQIDMTYNIKTSQKSVRIQLSENNAMKYIVTDNAYVFALEYGVDTVSRKAFFNIKRNEADSFVEGHIYEYVQYKDKDLVPSCADFYITNEYTSVVGNKASGLIGFKGYINELYKTSEGRLLGYEVRETITVVGISGTYNTLWFNLNNISGITSVKAIANENNTGTYTNKNPHDIYLNGSSKIFEPTYNKKLGDNTSRKYDVELRKQYLYGYVDNQLVEYETSIPMMFIQDDNKDDTNFSDFPTDILSKSGIKASVNLDSDYLSKIRSDYASLIDLFIENKDLMTGETIEAFIGDAIVIE